MQACKKKHNIAANTPRPGRAAAGNVLLQKIRTYQPCKQYLTNCTAALQQRKFLTKTALKTL